MRVAFSAVWIVLLHGHYLTASLEAALTGIHKYNVIIISSMGFAHELLQHILPDASTSQIMETAGRSSRFSTEDPMAISGAEVIHSLSGPPKRDQCCTSDVWVKPAHHDGVIWASKVCFRAWKYCANSG